MLFHAAPQRVEFVSGEGAVNRAPVDVFAGAGFIHNEAIHGGTTGAGAGFGNKGAVLGQFAFTTFDGFFNQEGTARIGINLWSV